MLQIRLKDAGAEDAVALTQKTILGSHPLVDVVVGDESHREVWPTHAVISKAGKKHMLMALDPKAVVKLNGAPVQQAAVKAGDVVQIGEFELLIEAAHSPTGDAVAKLLAASEARAAEPAAPAAGTDAGTKRRSKRVEEWGSDSWDLPFAGTEAPAPAKGAPPAALAPRAPAPAARTPAPAARATAPPVEDERVELDMSDMPEVGWGQHSLPTAGAAAPPPATRKPTTRRVPPPAPRPAPAFEDDDGVRIEAPVDTAARAPAAPAPPEEPEPIAPDDPLLLPRTDLPRRTDAEARKTKTRTIKGKRAASGRLQAVGADGRLDVDASIRAHSKRVEVADLAKKTDTVRVLNFSTIKGLIDDAVADAMATVGAKLDAVEREKLLKEAESEFKERLEAFQSEKAGLEAQALTLQQQLRRATGLLEEERKREVKSDQFTVSEAGISDMEERFGRMLKGAVKGGQVDAAFEEQIQQMIQHLLDKERDKIAEQARAAQSESIALLEKKIRRLAGSLEEAEAEASKQARRAQALEAMGGAVRGVAAETGIDDDDPDGERKLALLKEIFQQNQEIRDQLKGLGVQLKAPPGTEERRKARAEAEAARKAREAEAAALRAQDEAEDAADAAAGEIDAAADAADLPGEGEALPEPVAASAEDAEAGDAGDAGADGDGAVDPDDEVWQPGMSFRSEPDIGDEDDEDRNVRKVASFKKFEPPPLERK